MLNLGGPILRLECVNTDFFEPRLVATTVANAMIRSRPLPDFGTDEVDVITDEDFDNGAGAWRESRRNR